MLPNISDLPLLDNRAHIARLRRQQAVLWPEFSWQSTIGAEKTRCFRMFAPDISRVGYTDEGRVYALICPQQGISWPRFGTLNVEVTVTGQRGWVDEVGRSFAVDLTVEPRIWFSPSARHSEVGGLVWRRFVESGRPFPVDKARAIRLHCHRVGDPGMPVFPARDGESPAYAAPAFARHTGEAWRVGHLAVQIAEIRTCGDPAVDRLNRLVMRALNLTEGNILAEGNTLSWNLWFAAPEPVDQVEWSGHAERWRHSLQADHGGTYARRHPTRVADGRRFRPVGALVERACDAAVSLITTPLGGRRRTNRPSSDAATD